MPKVTINGKSIDVPKGTPIIRAAAMLGIDVPHFCYHPALTAPANCRMCLVEVEKARKLEPSCYLKVTDGMVVHTESPRVRAARAAVLEFILINHPVDCPICDQAGECKLQDFYVAYDAKPSRLETPKVGKAKAYPLGPHVVYDGERCILCTRCVRFCDEITGTSELTVTQRGDHSEIRAFPGRELDNPYSMNVTDVCPVGALTTRDFRFRCRVWLLTSTDSICTGCSRGCNVHLEHNQGVIHRLRPRFHPEVNEYWMCDAGRLSYARLQQDRMQDLRVGTDSGLSWPRAARVAASRIASSIAAHPGKTALAVSAGASSESLLVARRFAETVLGGARVYLVGRPAGDQDELLIRADKNPNRAGALSAFAGVDLSDSASLLADLESGAVQTLYLMGVDLDLDANQRARFVEAAGRVPLFVLQAAQRGDLAAAAHITLPAATHAEQTGTFTNETGHVQPFWQAFDPPGLHLADWAIFLALARGADKALPWSGFDAIQSELYPASAAE